MEDALADFVRKFQEVTREEAREKLGEIAFQRAQNPTRMGIILDADAFAIARGSCGDSLVMYLKFEAGRVTDAAFQTDGCTPTILCGSFAAELAIDQKPEEILDITGQTILGRCGGLPKANQHCAGLAAEALRAAARNYMGKQRREQRGLIRASEIPQK